MQGYDGVFLLEYLVGHSIRPSKVIYNGSKIMYMEVAKGLNIRICDTLNFLPMKLAALPKAFGLTELCKGYFPHYFNTRDNQHYVGLYPDAKAYGADFMSEGDRTVFLKWHAERTESGAVFDFRKEMEVYCRSDVDILRRGSLQFRQLMIEATGVDPFNYVTIASVCMGIYKTKFLETEFSVKVLEAGGHETSWIPGKWTHEGWTVKYDEIWEPLDDDASIITKRPFISSIAQVPSAGYVQKDTYSKASIQWLKYEMELSRRKGQPIHIQHAVNGSEGRILGTNYKVDGLCGNTVYEYHGKFKILLSIQLLLLCLSLLYLLSILSILLLTQFFLLSYYCYY